MEVSVITVKLYASLKVINNGIAAGKLNMPKGARVKDLLAELALKDSGELTILRDGKNLKLDDFIYDNDILHIFPYIGGG